MANKEVTLKRYDGSQPVDLFPTTTMNQVQVSTTDTTSITDFLVTNYINTDKLGAASGVATLDTNQKLTISQLPTGIAGGLKFRGSLGVDTDLDTLGDLYDNVEEGQGSYWIATADIELTATAHSVVLAPGDEGDSTFPITVEAGDWIVLSAWATDDYDFSILNNTYQLATDSADGIVRLSSATETTGTTSKVITESILGGMIGTDENKIAAGDHLHTGVYEPVFDKNTAFNKDFGTIVGTVAEGNHTHAIYALKVGDTFTGDVTLEKDGATSVGSHGIVFGYNDGASDFTKELNVNSSGNLLFGGHYTYVLENTNMGRILYDTTTGVREGDILVEIDT